MRPAALAVHEFLSSDSFPAPPTFPICVILLARRLVRRSFGEGGSLGEGGCNPWLSYLVWLRLCRAVLSVVQVAVHFI